MAISIVISHLGEVMRAGRCIVVFESYGDINWDCPSMSIQVVFDLP